MGTYEAVLQGLSPQAVTEAAQRFTMGDVQAQSKTFAPAIAEFVTEARKRQDIIDTLARKPKQLVHYRNDHLRPFEILRQKALTKFQDCPVLHEKIGHPEFMAMSKMGQIPAGGGWCAETGTVYGPPFEQISLGKRKQA
ncbi:hypothetical protein [Mesorhizobium sp. M7A.F.Ca.MR.362.00.0.0]|uniref:hypothetical protein n=1 Tax=Mesorhizobium sp. M7A.F.Ca.MR.362.00.0.0 TaxID=2496779 RepID=UPI000FD5235F|nr:hypothetical protein [Mesorhizobium sp. M7A.F.Ca.MR.362.00.0.0]RUU79998.1 hypothetical protein EOC06_13885 [Mesorhizobium sp. M7A.F.Ca.MR.362.00.0.0]